MKEIYTSYLNSPVPWGDLGFTRIRVCAWVHNGQQDRYDGECKSRYPTRAQLAEAKHLTDRDGWVKTYTDEILGELDPQQLYDSLPDKCVLMCHEKTEDDGSVLCHRRIVADWLQSELNVTVPEWLSPALRAKLDDQRRLDDFNESILVF